MRIGLDANETLEIELLENDRTIGTLSLQLKGLKGSSRVGRPAGTSQAAASAPSTPGRKQRKPRKPMSDEARARMAAAQKERWAKIREAEGNSDQQ